MPLDLISIEFRTPDTNDRTLPLRKNGDIAPPAAGPEWLSANGERSNPVAYLLDRTLDSEVTIKVVFQVASGGRYQVQAAGTDENIIRGVPSFSLAAAAPGLVSATVPLHAPILTAPDEQRVSKHLDALEWTAADDQGNPALSRRTLHPVYTALSTPQSPWDTNDQEKWPWTDALEVACDWAAGGCDSEQAASAITRKVFALGGQDSATRFIYSSGPSYVQPTSTGTVYGLIDFLETVTKVQPLGRRTLNCIDTACAVTTLSNLLGCSLAQGKIFPALTKPIILVGKEIPTAQNFGFHEIAWSGTGVPTDRIWDACVALADPGTAPFTPAAIPFDDGPSAYRPRFEDPSDRSPEAEVDGDLEVRNNRRLARIRSLQPLALPWPLSALSDQLPGSFECSELISRAGVEGYSITYRPDPTSSAWLEITIERGAAEGAQKLVRRIREMYAIAVDNADLGDLSFAAKDGLSLVYALSDYVVHIRNPGLVEIALKPIAAKIAMVLKLGDLLL